MRAAPVRLQVQTAGKVMCCWLVSACTMSGPGMGWHGHALILTTSGRPACAVPKVSSDSRNGAWLSV